MPAKAGTQGGRTHLRPWAPASAGATEKEELGTICSVHNTSAIWPSPTCFFVDEALHAGPNIGTVEAVLAGGQETAQTIG